MVPSKGHIMGRVSKISPLSSSFGSYLRTYLKEESLKYFEFFISIIEYSETAQYFQDPPKIDLIVVFVN